MNSLKGRKVGNYHLEKIHSINPASSQLCITLIQHSVSQVSSSWYITISTNQNDPYKKDMILWITLDTHIAKVVTVFNQRELDSIKNWKVRMGKQAGNQNQSRKHRRIPIYPAEMIQKKFRSVKGLHAPSVFLLQKQVLNQTRYTHFYSDQNHKRKQCKGYDLFRYLI